MNDRASPHNILSAEGPDWGPTEFPEALKRTYPLILWKPICIFSVNYPEYDFDLFAVNRQNQDIHTVIS